MAIESTPFGVTRLTGDDADAFLREMHEGRSNPAAREALRRGRIMMAQLRERATRKTAGAARDEQKA
jgi:hypothetical protein